MTIKLPLTLSTLVLLILFNINFVAAQKVTVLQQGKPTSIRGLSVLNDKVAWLSGSKGYVAITKDAGKTWSWQQVKGYEQADFRDVQAFSEKEAVIMSSGTPALILKTVDGGLSWQVKYHNRDTSVFLDAMDFKGKNGCAMADPINGHFVLLETKDKGNTWKQKEITKTPAAKSGEAGFAASGSCIMVYDNGIMKEDALILISGGTTANLMYGLLSGKKWQTQPLPIAQGTSSAGAFSMASDGKHWVVVGGDYQHDQRADSTVCYTINGGKNWLVTKGAPGFQSAVTFLGSNRYLSTGTSGTNITKDGGKTWSKIDPTGFNVCIKTQHGNWTLLAGNNGKIAVFQPPKKW